MNSRQNEKNREALIAVLTVCLIGVLVTVVIIAAVDLYRKHTYTAEIDPSEYLNKGLDERTNLKSLKQESIRKYIGYGIVWIQVFDQK